MHSLKKCSAGYSFHTPKITSIRSPSAALLAQMEARHRREARLGWGLLLDPALSTGPRSHLFLPRVLLTKPKRVFSIWARLHLAVRKKTQAPVLNQAGAAGWVLLAAGLSFAFLQALLLRSLGGSSARDRDRLLVCLGRGGGGSLGRGP